MGVTVDGTFIALAGGDARDGFQFALMDIPLDPAGGVLVEIDTDGDRTTFERSIEVTADLVQTAPDSFKFTLDLNDVLV